jgi:hypothetical protein
MRMRQSSPELPVCPSRFTERKRFRSHTSAGTQGTLSITDGTHNAKIALIGHYLAVNGIASSSGGANSNLFGTATDGSGGTLVTTTHQAP